MRKRRDDQSYRRQLILRGIVYGTLAILIFAAAASSQTQTPRVTLAQIAYINGPSTVLTGYGLVTGLNGTGDGQYLSHTDNSLFAALRHLGIDPGGSPVRTGEVAAVIVQCDIAAGTEPDTRLPVRITALGDASDLAGGTLQPVTLRSRDGRLSGFASGAIDSANSQPLGIVPASATLDRALTPSGSIFFTQLPPQDFVLEIRGLKSEQIASVAARINSRFGVIARAHSGCDIEINLPDAYGALEERANLVFQLADLPIDDIVPAQFVTRDSGRYELE